MKNPVREIESEIRGEIANKKHGAHIRNSELERTIQEALKAEHTKPGFDQAAWYEKMKEKLIIK